MKTIHPHGLTFEDALKYRDLEFARQLLKDAAPAEQAEMKRRWREAHRFPLVRGEYMNELLDISPGRDFDDAAFRQLVQDVEAAGIHVPTDEECLSMDPRPINRPAAMLKVLMEARQDALLERLLQAGLDLNKSMYARTGEETWPLDIACDHYPHLVPMFLKHGADPNGDGYWNIPLISAGIGEDVETINLLLDAGADPKLVSPEGWTLLGLAVNFEMDELVYRLLEMGVDANGGYDTEEYLPLADAIFLQRADYVERLLDAGASPFLVTASDINPDDDGQTPLYLAEERLLWAESPQELETAQRIVDAIYSRFPDIDRLPHIEDWDEDSEQKHAYMNAALWNASAYGVQEDAFSLLKYCGADASACNKAGVPALAVAAQRGHAGVVYELLCHGADPATAAPMPTARQAFTAEVRRLLRVFEEK